MTAPKRSFAAWGTYGRIADFRTFAASVHLPLQLRSRLT